MSMDGAVGVNGDGQMKLRAAGLQDQNVAFAQDAKGLAETKILGEQAKAFDAQIAHLVRWQL